MSVNEDTLYPALRRAVFLVVGLVALVWFVVTAAPVILLFLFAIVLAMAIDPPVTALERWLPRWAAALTVMLGLVILTGLLGWLVVPQVIDQAAEFGEDIPGYLTTAAERVESWISRQEYIPGDVGIDSSAVRDALPSLGALVSRIGRYTVSTVTAVVGFVVLLSSVAYMLISPRPLLAGYIALFPERLKRKASNAYVRSSRMVGGWMASNVIVGGVEGLAAGLFLWWLGIPAPLLWATLTFLSELIPKVGPYIMTIPPIIVALSIEPILAVWVVLFYVVMNEITGDTIAPAVRGKTMELHPVSLLFSVLALAALFGLWGALLATPLTGIAKVYFEEFWYKERATPQLDARYVDQMSAGREVDGDAEDEPPDGGDAG